MELAMAVVQKIREAYTFDDVLLKPGLSDILPSDADIRSHATRAIPLNIPIIASAMDTVTEARMAIAMAQAGGLGVIHRNFDPEGQAAQVRQVSGVPKATRDIIGIQNTISANSTPTSADTRYCSEE